MSRPRLAIVGGGITGLAAAYFLRPSTWHGAPPEVVLLESSDRLGGKVRTDPFDGIALDAGPDGFLAQKPWAASLCAELGLGDRLVPSAPLPALLWLGERLRPLPAGLALGVPARLGPVARAGILSPAGLARAAADLVLPARDDAGDESLGALVRRRLGAEVLDRLVDPLVGGVYAGRADGLSARSVAPALVEAERRARSLLLGLRGSAVTASPPRSAFQTLRGGLGRLVAALAAALDGVSVRTGAPVLGIAATPAGRYLLALPDGPEEFDAVLVALPAFAAATTLRPLCGPAASALEEIPYASVAVVALRYPPVAAPTLPPASGFLVPPREGRLMTACTWSSRKWPHLAPPDGSLIVRCSVGRADDASALDLDDGELVTRVDAELGQALRLRAGPTASRVTRWPRAIPQYAVGHGERLARIVRHLAPFEGLVLAGAAYRGLGLPDCVRQAREAAEAVRASLARRSVAARGHAAGHHLRT